MSIIAKALKKAEQERHPANGQHPTYTSSGQSAEPDKPQRAGSSSGAGARNYMKLVLPVSSVLLIAVLLLTFFSVKAKKKVDTIPSAIPANTLPEKSSAIRRKIEKPSPSIRQNSPPSLALTGIMYDPASPKAIINGNFVVTGTSLGSYTVREILYDRVILTDGIEDYELKVR